MMEGAHRRSLRSMSRIRADLARDGIVSLLLASYSSSSRPERLWIRMVLTLSPFTLYTPALQRLYTSITPSLQLPQPPIHSP